MEMGGRGTAPSQVASAGPSPTAGALRPPLPRLANQGAAQRVAKAPPLEPMSKGAVAAHGVALVALISFSAWLRWPLLRTWLWVDEGLSVGIAQHSLRSLPHLLRQDGAPPLFYVMLHFWIRWFGASEVSLHALSLIAALATIPAGLWLGWSLVSRRAGWFLAAMLATNPFLTTYSAEARPYSLIALLVLIVFGSYVHGVLWGRRAYLVPFVISLVLLLYTHNWALYVVLALLGALPVSRLAGQAPRATIRDTILAFGTAGLLFLAWVPTLVFQARHTAAPWSPYPGPFTLPANLLRLLGSYPQATVILLVTVLALLSLLTSLRSRVGVVVLSASVFVLLPPTLAWITSQWQPNWASRYLAAIVGVLLLVVAIAFVRLGWPGIAALCVVVLVWAAPLDRLHNPNPPRSGKSNVAAIARRLQRHLRPGDVILTAQPEQVGVLRYYLGSRYRYATPMGVVADPQIFDWRDAEDRLRRSSAQVTVVKTLAALPSRGALVLVSPVGAAASRASSWVVLFYQRARELDTALRTRTDLSPPIRVGDPNAVQPGGGSWVWAEVFQRATA